MKRGIHSPVNSGIVTNVATGSGNMIEDDIIAIKMAMFILLEKEYEKEKKIIHDRMSASKYRTLEERKRRINEELSKVDLKYKPILEELEE